MSSECRFWLSFLDFGPPVTRVSPAANGLGNLKSQHTAKGLDPVLTGGREGSTRLQSVSYF